MTADTSGGNNAAVGYGALNGNTGGSYNTASGVNALTANTNGSNNTALGYQAGSLLTTGSNNIDIGSRGVAGESNIIRLGDGSTQTDTYLTGNVHLTGTFPAPAAGATVDGSNLLRLTNTSMDGNTTTPDFVGIAFGQSATRQAIVGGTYGNDYLDFYTGGVLTTPKMRINNAGNVGIGTTSPAATLDVSGSLNAGSTSAGINLNGRTGIGSASASNCALNVKRFGSTETAANFVAESGVIFLQIGLNNGVALYANRASGLIERTDNSSYWDAPSDERIKHDVKPVAGALATLERLRPVRFHYNADFLAKSSGTPDYERFGVVAQEFQKVFPDFVDTNADGMLSVRMDPIPIVTAAAVQELDAADKQRDATVANLQAENVALKKRLTDLEAKDKERDTKLAAIEDLLRAKAAPTARNTSLKAGN